MTEEKEEPTELTEEVVETYLKNFGKRIEVLEQALFRLRNF